MKPNMGKYDRVIRTLIAVAIAILFFTKIITGTIGIVLLILAGIFLISSFISFCPMYSVFGISTKKKQSAS